MSKPHDADVRLVVHYSLPKTLEGFYQESGRAGRDGKPAQSVVFYGLSDRDRMDWILAKQKKSKGRKRKAGNRSRNAQRKCRNQAHIRRLKQFVQLTGW